MNQQNLERLFKKVDDLKEDAITLMKNLISINSVGPANDGPGEQELAEYLMAYLRDHGFAEIVNYSSPDNAVANGERPNVIAYVKLLEVDTSTPSRFQVYAKSSSFRSDAMILNSSSESSVASRLNVSGE